MTRPLPSSRPARRRGRAALMVALGAVAAWGAPAGCSSTDEGETHFALDDDGKAIPDLARSAALEDAFANPRRYPFTVAVAPLYIEWSDGGRADGESTVHGETLPSPLPGDDVTKHDQATRWPADRDPAEEEVKIVRAMREGFAAREAQTTPATGAQQGPSPSQQNARPTNATGTPSSSTPSSSTPSSEPSSTTPSSTPPSSTTPSSTPPANEPSSTTPSNEPSSTPSSSEPSSTPSSSEPSSTPSSNEPSSTTPSNEPSSSTPSNEPSSSTPQAETPPPSIIEERPQPAPSAEPTTPAPDAEPAPGPKKPRRVVDDPRMRPWVEGDLERDPARRRFLERRSADPPDEPTPQVAATGPISTVVAPTPAGWADVPPPAARGTVVLSVGSPDGLSTLDVDHVARDLAVPAGAGLQPDDVTADAWKVKLVSWRPELRRVERATWVEVGGAPVLDVRASRGNAGAPVDAAVWVVFLSDRVFTVTLLAAAEAIEPLATEVRAGLRVEGRPMERPRATPPAAARQPATSDAAAREADELEGKNFPISETGFQDRMAALLDQFGVFERVEKLKFVTDSQRRDPMALIPQADARGADLLLVGRLRRNKVSYAGITSALRHFGDFMLWLVLYWPSELWPGVKSEDYRSDVELVLEVVDVRSKEVLWSTTYRDDTTLSLSGPDRGWIPWGVILVNWFGLRTDGMFSEAGTLVRPRSWLEVEYQILRDLTSDAGFKAEIDAKSFEDRVNRGVEGRRLGLVVGVGQYGPNARDVLATLAFEGGDAAKDRGAQEAELRAAYGLDREDESLVLGQRPYGESDAQAMAEFLVNDASFGRGDVQVLLGEQATRVKLKAALRQAAKARRTDQVMVYINAQTVVADDPTSPGDELRKFILPWDADLAQLETLRLIADDAERTLKILAHLESTAISFEWLAETFNQESLEDHRYIMSRDVLMILDTAFPAPTIGLRYAPHHASLVASGWKPKQMVLQAPETAPVDTATPPGEQPQTPPEQPQTPPEQPQTPPEQPQTPPEQPVGPRPRERQRRVGQAPGPDGGAPTTLPAQAPAEGQGQPAGGPAKPDAQKPREPQLTDHFVQELSRFPGRKVVIAARWNDQLLDVVPQKRGAFVYHFLRGARDRTRVPARDVRDGERTFTVVDSSALLEYTRSRIEDESRTLNQPQTLQLFGDNDDFPVVKRAQ